MTSLGHHMLNKLLGEMKFLGHYMLNKTLGGMTFLGHHVLNMQLNVNLPRSLSFHNNLADSTSRERLKQFNTNPSRRLG